MLDSVVRTATWMLVYKTVTYATNTVRLAVDHRHTIAHHVGQGSPSRITHTHLTMALLLLDFVVEVVVLGKYCIFHTLMNAAPVMHHVPHALQ